MLGCKPGAALGPDFGSWQVSVFSFPSTMATISDSIAVSVSAFSRLPNSLPLRMTSSPVRLSLFSGSRSKSLPSSSGLKLQAPLRSSSASFCSRIHRVSRYKTSTVCEAQENAIDISSVNDTTWESLVLNTDGPVLVEFWAPWCGPCRMIHPVIGELAEQYAQRLKWFKLNTDESPSIATKYGIRSVPTIIIFVNGEKKEAVIGAVPKTTLSASIEKFL